MRDHYDFKGGERGKFYHRDAVLIPPVHLDAEILPHFKKRAEEHGISLSDEVNRVLRDAMEPLDAAE